MFKRHILNNVCIYSVIAGLTMIFLGFAWGAIDGRSPVDLRPYHYTVPLTGWQFALIIIGFVTFFIGHIASIFIERREATADEMRKTMMSIALWAMCFALVGGGGAILIYIPPFIFTFSLIFSIFFWSLIGLGASYGWATLGGMAIPYLFAVTTLRIFIGWQLHKTAKQQPPNQLSLPLGC